MAGNASTNVVAYLRTSSATNVDGDSETRQLAAIDSFAKSHGYALVEIFRDQAVSGTDAIDMRPGFRAMLERLLSNGVRTIIVENASRFSRDLIVQETGYAMLRCRGIDLIAADSPSSFLDDGPTATLVRQILGAVAQFEKAMVVAKLRGARDRKRATGVKVEGRPGYAETQPELVKLAKKLHRYPINGRRRSLREIAAELARAGHLDSKGKPLAAITVKRLIAR